MAHVKLHSTNLRRCLLLLQGMVSEAERRGHGVGTAHRCQGLAFVIKGHDCEVTIKEVTERIPHELSASEQRNKDRGHEWGIPRWNYLPTGRLEIRSGHGSAGSILASDGQRWTLDTRLGRAFERLEESAAKAEARRLERLGEEERRQRRRDAALARARDDYFEKHRVDSLAEQIDRWKLARDAREFLSDIRSRRHMSDAEEEWLAWIDDYAKHVDPLMDSLAPDEPPEPSEYELRPFLSRVW